MVSRCLLCCRGGLVARQVLSGMQAPLKARNSIAAGGGTSSIMSSEVLVYQIRLGKHLSADRLCLMGYGVVEPISEPSPLLRPQTCCPHGAPTTAHGQLFKTSSRRSSDLYPKSAEQSSAFESCPFAGICVQVSGCSPMACSLLRIRSLEDTRRKQVQGLRLEYTGSCCQLAFRPKQRGIEGRGGSNDVFWRLA